MKHYLVIIPILFLFTSCFTVSNVRKAKLDRKPEVVDSLLTSYQDENGNVSIIYTKQKDKNIYKSVIPVDTIIQRYIQNKSIDFINTDTTIKNFKGVFFTENINNEKGFQRLIYYNREEMYLDTSKFSEEVKNNKDVAAIIRDKIIIPIFETDTATTKNFTKSKVIAFVLTPQSNHTNRLERKETYIVVFAPTKKKYARYFLTPFTVGLDVVTLPGQIVFYGTILLIAKTIKF